MAGVPRHHGKDRIVGRPDHRADLGAQHRFAAGQPGQRGHVAEGRVGPEEDGLRSLREGKVLRGNGREVVVHPQPDRRRPDRPVRLEPEDAVLVRPGLREPGDEPVEPLDQPA